jgi:hypothetical protein
LARVTRATNFFILQICKNDIILDKILQKKKSMGFKTSLKKNKKNLMKKLDHHSFDHDF